MLRRLLVTLVGAIVAVAALVGIEILVALRRDYLPTEPALVIGGTFGRGDPLTFVVMGDSTAAGVGAGSAEHAYPTRLTRALSADGHRVTLVDLGISGARVADVLEDQVPEAIKAAPDLVFIGIGANDVTHLTPLDALRDDTRAIIEKLRPTGATVVLAGAPDMRARAFWEPLRTLVGWRGRAVTYAIEEAVGDRATVVPLAERTGPLFAKDPERYYSDDDFHPSAAGYGLWVDAILPELRDALTGAAP